MLLGRTVHRKLMALGLRGAIARGLILVAVWAVALAALSDVSDAYSIHSCRYASSSPAIGYKFHSVTTRNQTAVHDARTDWNNTSAAGYFYHDTGGDPELDVYDASYAGSFWAFVDYAEHDCSSSGGTWDYNETDLHIDTNDTASLSTSNLAIVMVHELGHTYGLDHTSLTCSTGPSVMRQGSAKFSCSGTAPWTDDVNGVNFIY